MERLAQEWESGACRFQGEGETLLGAVEANVLLGIGGLTREPTARAANIMRVRRFYIAPGSRNRGLGRAIAEAVLARADQRRAEVWCNASANSAADSAAFWERLGFTPVAISGITHVRAARHG
jgi:GNAT superfamily N-acetyltransferase